MSIEAGSHRRAALGKLVKPGKRHLYPLDTVVDLRRIAAEFLAQGERRGVLHVGASDLQYVLERLSLVFQRLVKAGQRRIEPIGDLLGGGDMHGRGKGIVGGLAEIDVVVGVNRLLGAELAAQEFAGAVCDHLVEVHIGLGAGAGLPNHQGKMTVELAVHDLVCRRGDRLRQVLIEAAELEIGQRRSLLDERHGADQRLRHPLVADFEVLPRALGLRAPIAVGRDFDRPERVGFGAG